MTDPLTRELSDRELSVLELMSRGCSNPEIGRKLVIAEDTVKTHARRLFRVLGARDRAHAVRLGFESGILRGRHAPGPLGIPGVESDHVRAVARALLVAANQADARSVGGGS